MAVAAQMEKDAMKPVEKKIGGMNEDAAVAAYAEFMGSGGSFEEDPVKVAAAKKKLEDEKAA